MSFDISKNINSFLGRIYSDEPIKRVKKEKLPAIIRTIREIERLNMSYMQTRETIFIKQAKLLANYEDSYEFKGQIHRYYYPTYQSLSNDELRGYLSWRTKLRRGVIEPAPLCFAFLYIYELLNQIGCADPLDGYNKLAEFYNKCADNRSIIRWYLDFWLWDYVIYYNLPPELLNGNPRIEADRRLLSLIKAENADELMDSMTVMSSYRVENSRYYKSFPQDFAEVTARIWRRMAEHYAKRRKKSLVEDYFGDRVNRYVPMFRSAVFYRGKDKRTFDYKADDICIYHCENGRWSSDSYNYDGSKSKKLGDLLRTVDSVIREVNGYKYPTKPAISTKWIVKIITEECLAYADEKREAARKRIDFDLSSLSKIRHDAAVTRDRLIVDGEELLIGEEPEIDDIPAEAPVSDTGVLSPEEYRLMQCLLYGMPTDWVRNEGLMLSVMIDSVNEKLFDDFGDTVLEYNDGAQVVEDYIDELKEIIKP